MNPDNPVVRLCGEGMAAEAGGRAAEARALFERAWEVATDDYEACIAAHYLARQQPTPEDTLHWNEVCLELADRVGDERVAGFHASLHATLARAHAELDRAAQARRHFRLAAEHLDAVQEGPYRDWLRYAIAEGLRASGAVEPPEPARRAADLLARFCTRADLRSLCLLLPAYYGDLGTPADAERLIAAARMLHAERRLPAAEQHALGELITSASTVESRS